MTGLAPIRSSSTPAIVACTPDSWKASQTPVPTSTYIPMLRTPTRCMSQTSARPPGIHPNMALVSLTRRLGASLSLSR